MKGIRQIALLVLIGIAVTLVTAPASEARGLDDVPAAPFTFRGMGEVCVDKTTPVGGVNTGCAGPE